jgi:hypothetical protein
VVNAARVAAVFGQDPLAMLAVPGRKERVDARFALRLRIAAAHVVIDDRERAKDEEANGG